MVLCYLMIKNYNAVESGFDPTIFEMDKNYVLVDQENLVLSYNYIGGFVYDATENYYERKNYGCRSSHVTKTPLFMLKVLKLRLLYLPILNALCFMDLFSYKMPMHRKRVDLNVFDIFFMMLSCAFQLLFLCEHH